jgi:hypothetical protein
MTTFVLVLLVSMGNRGVAMTNVPDFSDRDTCESTGNNWRVQAQRNNEDSPRFYCVPMKTRME